ncbi:ABC transporter permease [Bacillus tuaregi]|uniref:ABC transporter permease n=1 Tax=Bacillus tuaregi TaxID=1816695 RepID=UPI0008F80925|nr:ABC transporter permease [Bacillus tuaregi]
MTFRQFAFNNVIRNKRLYAAYFLSSLFTVMVFFAFALFSFHPVLSGNEMNQHVKTGMMTAAGIIYVFSFFFILYSMSSFLQSRKKEFGLLMMQGMSMRQIRSMVFLENMVIGFFATISGIGLGLVFAKGILLLAENVLIIENLHFYIPILAILLTFISFIVLFFFISLFVSYILRSKKLIELIKSDKQSKGEPKANLFLTILAAALLAIGYGVALLVKGMTVIAAMIPVIIVVMFGTYLLFTQLSVFVIHRLKKKDTIFWYKTNMLLFSDLSFRMKDNARTFFMVAMVSTVAFSAIGTLFGFQTLLTEGTKIMTPNTLTYMEFEDNEEQDVSFINKTLSDAQIETNKAQMMLRYYEIGKGPSVLIAKQSDYNRFADLIGEEKIELQDGQIVVAEFEGVAYGQTEELMNQTIELNSGVTLKPNEVIYSRALPAPNSYYVITDHDYEKLPTPNEEISFHAWQAIDGEKNVLKASETLYEELLPHEITVGEYKVYQINKTYGPIMFVGLFIGIVFFVSAGSFLYFRLYTDLDEDKQKFKAIAKMGLTEKELKKVLNRQTAILFFAPIIVALIHGAVALTALSHMFNYNLFKESVIVLGVFFVIQVIYFFIVRFFYTKQIKAAIH